VKGIRIVDADELRAHVRFENLIEPVSKGIPGIQRRPSR
jgi:hypothetical protein